MKVEYVRDKRSPIPTNATVSRVMSANKRRDTSPELELRRLLRKNGVGGYRLHCDVPGRPDISYPGKRVAIFVNGCYWHRCPKCDLPLPKNNTAFWEEKFRKNVERDGIKIASLESSGWTVITVWECELKNNPDLVIETILSIVKGGCV